jgi:electron transfer flavoprotein beta subunit
MEILVCVKRVPTVGGAITLTADRRAIDTKMSGFTISPHEECAVEEAVRLVERVGDGGDGPAAAEEQLRSCLALGASAAVLLETEPGAEVGPCRSGQLTDAAVSSGARSNDRTRRRPALG